MARRFNRTSKTNKYKQKYKNYKQKNKTLKHETKINKAKQFVRNLSTHVLSDYEILVLAKGVKYIKTPTTKNLKNNILSDFDELARKMRCTYLFDDGTPYHKHPFYMNTGFKPNTSTNSLENYIFSTKLELSKIKIRTRPNNLSPQEQQALIGLKQNENIIIRKADKNSTLCVLNKTNYIREGLRQLQNEEYYTEIKEPKTSEIAKQVSRTIHNLYNCNQIDKITYKFLTSNINDNKLGKFFLLPKLHKIHDNILTELETNIEMTKNFLIPGRPIVSLCGTPLQNIGHFIDYIITSIRSKLIHLYKRYETFH